MALKHKWLFPNFATPDGRMKLSFQAFVLKSGKDRVMIDTCIGNDREREFDIFSNMHTSFLEDLESVGYPRESITKVLCTHLHFDHVGWNTMKVGGKWVPTFPNARYLFSQREYDYWAEEHKKNPVDAFDDSVLPVVAAKKADFVSSEHALDDHVRLSPTPGHTPDHFAVCLGRRGEGAVMTGDLIHSPLQARYPDLSMRVDYNPAQGIATRRKFLETYCDTSTQCCFMHFPSPSRGYVKRWGDGFRCEYIRLMGAS